MVHSSHPSRSLRSTDDLVSAGLVAPTALPAIAAVQRRYAIGITPAMAALINRADGHDPIAAQFVPDGRELVTTAEEHPDPIGDKAHSPVPGIVHRYPDRALLKIVHTCPVYCRFCFRREMVGPGGQALAGEALDRAVGYIAATPAIREIIITGGDPFMLSARRVRDLMRALSVISHVRIVRWHTRVPIVDPARVTPAFVKGLKIGGKAVYVGIHANHPREFHPEACAAIARLVDAGIVLVSQSVLLKGVNADPNTLATLMRAFLDNRILPYYLHHPDLAPGTGHFRLDIAEGQALMRALRGDLSGLAQPTYVLDIPGGHGKVPIGPSHLAQDGEGGTLVTDPWGVTHVYPPRQAQDP